MSPRRRVLLIGWDAYPHFAYGGVYRWQRSLIEGLPDWQFVVFNQLSNPNASANYNLPNNVKVIGIPIFGTSRYEEYYDDDGRPIVSRMSRTTEEVVSSAFLPLFDSLLEEILFEECDQERLQEIVCGIHSLFAIYDYKKCLESPRAWENFLKQLDRDRLYKEMKLSEAATAFRIIQRFLQLLSVRLPEVDLVQCALAWLPSLLAIVAKREFGAPVVVTEHGVAFRELLLTFNAYIHKESSRILWKTVATNVIKTVYSVADVVVPVSRVNASWQQRLGTPPAKIKLIYNGIDVDRFVPMNVPRLDERPTVVTVARIEPFKDIVCLIQAIKYVREHEPNVGCLIFGESITLEYATKCANAVKEARLEESVKFMGATREPEKVYNAADVVVISSVTEGLPLTVVEAMACGRAVVSADVGGVREALQGCGILVKSRNPYELGQAIVTLLRDEKLRSELGAAGIRKARAEFSHKHMVSEYSKLYESLTAVREREPAREAALQESRVA